MNVFGRQVVTGAVCAAGETWVWQIAMFGAFVALARHARALGPGALKSGALKSGALGSGAFGLAALTSAHIPFDG